MKTAVCWHTKLHGVSSRFYGSWRALSRCPAKFGSGRQMSGGFVRHKSQHSWQCVRIFWLLHWWGKTPTGQLPHGHWEWQQESERKMRMLAVIESGLRSGQVQEDLRVSWVRGYHHHHYYHHHHRHHVSISFYPAFLLALILLPPSLHFVLTSVQGTYRWGFLGAFPKLRKETISVMSVCPNGTTRLPMDGFW